jgi:4'-phosphopantetheinyl transferase
MIKIFYCNSSDENIPKEISEYRLNKILLAKKDRLSEINTAKALKAGFASFGINEQDVIYEISENGKPFAKNFPAIHFSISHSNNFSIVVFYDKEIGIDCENKTREISKETLSRFFTSKEIDDFSKFPLRLWISKESYVKYTGLGLALGRNAFQIPYYEDCIFISDTYFKRFIIGDYECAVCTSKNDALQIEEVI